MFQCLDMLHVSDTELAMQLARLSQIHLLVKRITNTNSAYFILSESDCHMSSPPENTCFCLLCLKMKRGSFHNYVFVHHLSHGVHLPCHMWIDPLYLLTSPLSRTAYIRAICGAQDHVINCSFAAWAPWLAPVDLLQTIVVSVWVDEVSSISVVDFSYFLCTSAQPSHSSSVWRISKCGYSCRT